MLVHLLFKNQNKTQLIIASIAALLGFTFLLTSIHYFEQVRTFGKSSEILGSNILIIQKKVSNFSSMALSKNDFSTAELENMKGLEFTENVEPILNNNFDVSLQTNSELVPYFRSDVFVQSISADFIDLPLENWAWQPNDNFVPIILPREFLVMLNTFASAKGIPQVSDELAKSIGFKFTLSNSEKKEWHDAKIIGFTSEVSSILVPHAFLEYGNKNFPIGKPEKISQVLVSVKEGNFGTFENWMKERNLESKKSAMVLGKAKSIASALFSIVIAVSILVIFLAGLTLLQYSQLIIYKNSYELTTLLHIGYSPKTLLNTFSNYFLRISLVVTFASALLFVLFKFWIDEILHQSGIQIALSFTFWNFAAVVLVVVIYYLVNMRSTKLALQKLR